AERCPGHQAKQLNSGRLRCRAAPEYPQPVSQAHPPAAAASRWAGSAVVRPALRLRGATTEVRILREHLVAELDAHVADVDAGTGDQLLHLVLALAAERAAGVASLLLSRPGH